MLEHDESVDRGGPEPIGDEPSGNGWPVPEECVRARCGAGFVVGALALCVKEAISYKTQESTFCLTRAPLLSLFHILWCMNVSVCVCSKKAVALCMPKLTPSNHVCRNRDQVHTRIMRQNGCTCSVSDGTQRKIILVRRGLTTHKISRIWESAPILVLCKVKESKFEI